jgi:hypothetical protein
MAAYDLVRPIAFKSDVFRYCALLAAGGMYVDDDVIIHPDGYNAINDAPGGLLLFQDLYRVASRFPLRVNKHLKLNGWMAAKAPNHPVVACALATAVTNILQRRTDVPILDFTGPGALGQCVLGWSDVLVIGYADKHSQAHVGDDWHMKSWGTKLTLATHTAVPRDTSVAYYGNVPRAMWVYDKPCCQWKSPYKWGEWPGNYNHNAVRRPVARPRPHPANLTEDDNSVEQLLLDYL